MEQQLKGMESRKIINEFGGIVRELQQLSVDLLNVIDQQISAVVSSDEAKVEQFLEEYTSLRKDFKEKELEFIHSLQVILNGADINYSGVQLKLLKKVYPNSAEIIEKWQNELEQKTGQLKRKHKKLNKLLEFAITQNRNLMCSIYGLQDQKNTHYGSSGDKEEIYSGIAVNKEA